jgi:serine/threonine protein kinase
MYIYSSSIKMLPPALLANLEFAFNEAFTQRIEDEHNPFRVSIFIMELFDNSLTLHDVIHDDWIEPATADTPEELKTRDPRYAWKKNMLDIVRSSTQLCVDAGFSGDTEAVIQEACLLRVDRKYTSTCVILLLSRLRRHVISVYKHGISHADFSLSNCLMNAEGKITFIDYGMSSKMSETIARFHALDEPHQIEFIVNSCKYPNYRNYKWLFKNAYDDQRRGSLDKTPVPLGEMDAVVVAPESTIVLFRHKDVKGFAEGAVMLT